MMATLTKPKEIGLILTEENTISALEGIKTNTRRVIPHGCYYKFDPSLIPEQPHCFFKPNDRGFFATMEQLCDRYSRYGKAGDLFYLQEPTQVKQIEFEAGIQTAIVVYRDGTEERKPITLKDIKRLSARKDFTKKASSRFMLKSFARYWFVNKGVQIERLQDISEKDAIAEGIQKMSSGYWTGGPHKVKGTPKHMPTPIEGFRDLWDSINRDRGYGWEANPWVWVVEFERIDATV